MISKRKICEALFKGETPPVFRGLRFYNLLVFDPNEYSIKDISPEEGVYYVGDGLYLAKDNIIHENSLHDYDYRVVYNIFRKGSLLIRDTMNNLHADSIDELDFLMYDSTLLNEFRGKVKEYFKNIGIEVFSCSFSRVGYNENDSGEQLIVNIHSDNNDSIFGIDNLQITDLLQSVTLDFVDSYPYIALSSLRGNLYQTIQFSIFYDKDNDYSRDETVTVVSKLDSLLKGKDVHSNV